MADSSLSVRQQPGIQTQRATSEGASTSVRARPGVWYRFRRHRVAVTIYTVIGVILGSFSGFYGGLVDSVIMRLADVVLSFPSLILIITVVSVLGPSIYNIMLVIGLLGWPPIARIVRALFLSLREREFVLASRTIGVPNVRIIFRHILPNAIAPVIVAATFGMANAILLEAGLSFLGLGVQPPTPSWGNMLKDAQSLTVLESMPWLWIPPGTMIALAVLSINFIGDGLLDAMREAANAYVVLDELQDKASEVIARATGAEAGIVVGGAEAGLLIGTAAILAGTDPAKIAQLPVTDGMANEAIMHRSHRN